MACFLVPAGEAVVTTVVQKVVEKREEKAGGEKTSSSTGLKWSRRLGWLNKLLWGGTILLALEHIWHGEVVPWPPFLTAIGNPGEVAQMLHEMATVGVAMAITITVVWGIMVVVAELKAKAIPEGRVKPISGGE